MRTKVMHVILPGTILLLAQPFAAVGQAQSFMNWMEEAAERQNESLESIELYLQVSAVMGLQMALPGGNAGPCAGKTCQAYKVENTVQDGATRRWAYPLSPMELGVMSGDASSDFLSAFGNGFAEAQTQINSAEGGPGALFGPLAGIGASGDPTAMAIDPSMMFGTGGAMMLGAADAASRAEASLADSSCIAQSQADRSLDLYREMEYADSEELGTTLAHRYDNARINQAFPPKSTCDTDQQDREGQGTLNSASIWVDPEAYRFLKQRMEGTTTMEGEVRDFFIEIEYSDFRNPPGCGQMDQPFRRVMRMGGMLGDEEMAQMEEARAQLAEFEQQLAAMPAQQRQMMERMMGSQMATMRSLISTGAFEFVEQTEQIICNPNLAGLFTVAPEQAVDQDLVRQIQEYLVILGYEPGNIDGVLDDLTRVAISQFQAEQGLPVTGEPSLQLGTRLAAAVTG